MRTFFSAVLIGLIIWSVPFNGEAVIDVSGNTTADAVFDLLVGIFVY